MLYKIETSYLKDRESSHKYLKELFNFNDDYTYNLDALYDELSSLNDIELIINLYDKGNYFNNIKQVLEDLNVKITYINENNH